MASTVTDLNAYRKKKAARALKAAKEGRCPTCGELVVVCRLTDCGGSRD